MTSVTAAAPALKVAERINRIEPSATMAVVAEADKLRRQGVDVVDLSVGEPHFATPQHIKDAAIAAIQNNFTKYTAAAGTIELRDAIVHRHNVDFDSDYRREESMASVGGKHVLFNAIQALVDHGDEVILPVPYWVSFKDIVCYAGGKCVYLESDEQQGFRVTAEMVARLVTPRTKLIILNSPSNPSGAVMSPEDQREVMRLASERGIWVLSDECYVYLNYTGQALFAGDAARVSRPPGDCWFTFENLCHDRLAAGIRAWPCGSDQRYGQVAEPVHVKSYFDCAESGGGGAYRSAGVRRRDACRLHQAAQAYCRGLAIHPRREVCHAGGRVLRLSEHFFVLRA